MQHICSRLLATPFNKITTVVQRFGGGFGGKESNASWIAGAAALLAWKTGKPVKLRLPRDTDMLVTGKRHGFQIRYEVGFDRQGRILAFDVAMAANGGHSTDHTPSVLTKALTHADNCYWISNFRAVGYACKTNTVSNTAFRGYGAPQAVVVMEDVIDQVACRLLHTPEEIRAINFYHSPTRAETPYGQKITDDLIERCVAQVMRDGQWDERRREIDAFNRTNRFIKGGLGLFPLKFGISFPAQFLNQASALVHVYADGSIRLNHGGTEMGQGLFIKVAQVVAEVLGVSLDRISLSATSTAEVPNTSPTAASTASDLNGWAAHNAAETIKQRMIAFAAKKFDAAKNEITFRDDHVQVGLHGSNRILSFGELAKLCWLGRVPLWPQVSIKRRKSCGIRPPCGDGHFSITPTVPPLPRLPSISSREKCACYASILCRIVAARLIRLSTSVRSRGHSCRAWMAAVQELWWDREGRLCTVGPSTYKIPGSRDVPPVLNVHMLDDAPARVHDLPLEGDWRTSIVVSDGDTHRTQGRNRRRSRQTYPVLLDSPATPERILMALIASE